MSRTIHMRLDIRGAIENGTAWKWVSTDDGRPVKKAEAVSFLLDRLAEGKRFLPLGHCDGFDFQKGCPGHEETDERGEAHP